MGGSNANFMLISTSGVADLIEPESYFMGIQLHEGQPLCDILLNIVITDTRLCEETDHELLIMTLTSRFIATKLARLIISILGCSHCIYGHYIHLVRT